MKSTHVLIAAAVALSAASAHAQSTPSPVAERAAASGTAGEVRKIDKGQGKVTLKHGPIANLDMPGMTMVFKVADPKMLEGLQEGDKVTFTADRVKGAITVTALQPAQ